MGLLDAAQAASNTIAGNVSAPVDLIAWILRKAGVPVGTPIGGSDWMAQQGLTREVQPGLSKTAGETFGLLAPMVAAAKAPEIARGLLQHAEDFQKYNRSAGVPGVAVVGKSSAPEWADELASAGGAINPDGTVTVYHRTSKEAAKAIRERGLMVGKEDGLFFSTRPDGQATGYGDTVVKLRIPAKQLELDDIFKDEAHFKIPTKTRSVDVSRWLEKPDVTGPQSAALRQAQINAAKPVSEGGLGLGPNNTPMERAKAMGFTTDAYHGTPDDRIVRSRQFKNEMLGKQTRVSDAKKGHFTTSSGDAASEFIWHDGSTDGGNVLPLMLRGDRMKATAPGEWMPGRFDAAIDRARQGGYAGVDLLGTTTLGKPGDYQVTFDPRNIRSRFAAFDPAKRDSADILAGLLGPALLAPYLLGEDK